MMRAVSLGYHEILEPGKGTCLPPSVLLYCLDRHDFGQHLSFVWHEAQGAVQTITGFGRWGFQIPLFLTFDDGGAGTYTCVADELESRGWRGHFLITTDWIGRPAFLSAGQIRELHLRGHVIGSHSRSHPARMSRLSRNDLDREWHDSCARLADIIGARISVASVPDGYYSSEIAKSAARCGIEALFTSEPTRHIQAVDGCLVLGRYTILRGMAPRVSGALASGQVWPRWRQTIAWQCKKVAKAMMGTYYLSLRRHLLANRLGPTLAKH